MVGQKWSERADEPNPIGADKVLLLTDAGGNATASLTNVGNSIFITRTSDDLSEGATNLYMLSAEKSKLAGIEAGATANSTDAFLLDRTNHTGTQLLSSISDAGLIASLNEIAEGNLSIDLQNKINTEDQSSSQTFTDGVDFTKGVDDTITLGFTPADDANLTIWFNGGRRPRSTWSRIGNVITFSTTIPIDVTEIEVDNFSGTIIPEVFTDGNGYNKGSSDQLRLSVYPSSKDEVTIWFDGAYKERAEYSLSGNIITFTSGNIAGDVNEIEVDILIGTAVTETFIHPADFTQGVSNQLTLENLPISDAHLDIRFDNAYQLRSTWTRVGKVITFDAVIPIDVNSVEIDVLLSHVIPQETVKLISTNFNKISGEAASVDQELLDGIDFTKGTSTTIKLNRTPSSPDHLRIWFNGAYKPRSEWTLSGNTVTFNSVIPIDVKLISTKVLLGTAKVEIFSDGADFIKGTDDAILLTSLPKEQANVMVWFDGAYKPRWEWTLSGKVLTFSSAIPIDIDEIEVRITIGNTKFETLLDGIDFTKGVDDTITITNAPSLDDHLTIRFGGALQDPSTWTRTGNSITFDAIIPIDVTEIEVDTLISSYGEQTITDEEREAINANSAKANYRKFLIDGIDYVSGTNDTITLPQTPISDAHLNLSFDNVKQKRSDWTRTGATVQFSATIPLGIKKITADIYCCEIAAEVFNHPADFTQGVSTDITIVKTPISDDHIKIWMEGAYQPRSTWSRVGNVITFNSVIPIDVNQIEVDIIEGSIAAEVFADGVDFVKGTDNTITLVSVPASDSDIEIRFQGAMIDSSQWRRKGQLITFNSVIPIDVTEITADILISGGGNVQLTASEIKSLYEGNADTNAFTDADLAKVNEAVLDGDYIGLTVFSGQSKDISGTVTLTTGHALSPDRTRLYALDVNGNSIEEFTLTTPGDVSTATPSSSFNLALTTVSSPVGLAIKPDGNKLYLIDNSTKELRSFTFGTPFLLSTLTDDVLAKDLSATLTAPSDIAFRSDGLKLLVTDQTNNDISQFSMSIAWDISTLTEDVSSPFDLTTDGSSNISGIAYNIGENRIYINDAGGTRILEYDAPLGVIDNISLNKILIANTTTENAGMYSLHVSGNQLTMVGRTGNDTVFAYDFPEHAILAYNGGSLGLDNPSISEIKEDSIYGRLFGENSKSLTPTEVKTLLGIVDPYVSGLNAITAAGQLVLSHGLGVQPTKFKVLLKCNTIDGNFAVGDIVDPRLTQTSSSNQGVQIHPDSTNLTIRFGSGSGVGNPVFKGIDPTTGSSVNLTNANWDAIFIAEKEVTLP